MIRRLLLAALAVATVLGTVGIAAAGPPPTETCSTWTSGGFPSERAVASCTAPAGSGFDTFRVHATCYVPPFSSYTVTGPWDSTKGGTSTSALCAGTITNRYAEFLT